MFDITEGPQGELRLHGRLDASQADKAKSHFSTISESTIVDFAELEYISSAGLGVLLATQKKMSENGHALRLVNVNRHIRDVFHFSGFDQIFQIE